jgi:hypothetical protein
VRQRVIDGRAVKAHNYLPANIQYRHAHLPCFREHFHCARDWSAATLTSSHSTPFSDKYLFAITQWGQVGVLYTIILGCASVRSSIMGNTLRHASARNSGFQPEVDAPVALWIGIAIPMLKKPADFSIPLFSADKKTIFYS